MSRLIVLAALALPLAPPVAPADWPMDQVRVQNGHWFPGQILSETEAGMWFRVVRRRPGRPTITLTTLFTPGEVVEVRRATDAERGRLARRLARLDPDGADERSRMTDLALGTVDWPGGGKARSYTSEHFTLVSNAPDEIVRRAAVRLEQIFTAYDRFLPNDAVRSPPQVVLAATTAEYQELQQLALGHRGEPLQNPALYDPKTNRILCGTDLKRLSEELAATRLRHAAGRAKLDAAEAEFRRLYAKPSPELDRFLATLSSERDRLRQADKVNDLAYQKVVDQLLTLLYHEAFHAYAALAFPGSEPGSRLPRWLNEGLAQVFESAIVEAGELRVGHAEPARLARVQKLLDAGELTPLATLLRSGGGEFLTRHRSGSRESDRAYLTAWALAFHVTFHRHRLGGPGLDRYLTTAGDDPVAAFEAWVGEDLPAFETRFHADLKRLLPDGTLRPNQ